MKCGPSYTEEESARTVSYYQFEASIDRHEDPTAYRYVIEFPVLRASRTRPIKFTAGYRIISESRLKTGAPSFRVARGTGKGMFLRRLWVLPIRLGDSALSIPIGAVVPLSIAVGKVSQRFVEVPL